MKQLYVLLGACVAASSVSLVAAQPAPVIDVAGQATSSSTNSPLIEQLSSLEQKLDARNRAQVKIQRQLTDLQTEVDELRGVTELHNHKLEQILLRQRELYQELDRRVSEAIQPAAVPPATIAVGESNANADIAYSDNLTENQAYDRAVNLVLKEKQYDQAIVEFETFNKKFPNSTYAANASYWLGQLLFNKNRLEEAKSEFSRVVNNFPDSAKRSDAMLKLAMVAQKQSDMPRAKVLFQQVIDEYAGSSAAQIATTRLSAIN